MASLKILTMLHSLYTFEQSSWTNLLILFVFQSELDAHEDDFKACAEEGQELLDDNHPASDEVKEKVGLLGSR